MSLYQQISRCQLMSNIKEEYDANITAYENEMLYKIKKLEDIYNYTANEIKEKYTKLKTDLYTTYINTLKRIDAIYDSYEITLSQLYAYGSTDTNMRKVLESSISEFNEFNDFNEYRLITTAEDYTCKRIELNLELDINLELTIVDDLYSIQNSVFFCQAMKQQPMPYSLIIKSNVITDVAEVSFNNLIYSYTQFSFIKEKDIIILWSQIWGKHEYNINFIQVSSGKLIYCEHSNDRYIDKFIYCDNTIIQLGMCDKYYLYMRKYTFNSINRTYNKTDLLKFRLKSDKNILSDTPKYTKSQYFYNSQRGLYFIYHSVIYFIGKLSNLDTATILLDSLTQFNIKPYINSSCIYDSYIYFINYSNNEIYIGLDHQIKGKHRKTPYKISLGVLNII